MRTIKKRKNRSQKKNGYSSIDFCECCYSPYCDPSLRHPKVEKD